MITYVSGPVVVRGVVHVDTCLVGRAVEGTAGWELGRMGLIGAVADKGELDVTISETGC